MKKRIFVDVYLAFNLGDDLFLDILAKKFPNCEFVVNYVGSNYDHFLSRYHNVSRRKYTSLHKVARRLNIYDPISNYKQIAAECDALVFIGGSIFRDESYHKSLYKDRMEMVREFKERKKSVFVLGANFGPVHSKEFVADYKKFFQLCDDVCFREVHSYEIFHDLPQVRYAPDIVFQMETEDYINTPKVNKVGFSIINVNHKQGLSHYYQEYIESTVKTIDYLVSKEYECCLMSFCEQEGDLHVINEILQNLPELSKNKISVYKYEGNMEEAIHLIASFSLFIAARFHANILALLLGNGVMPIIYSDRTLNMLKDLQLEKVAITMNDLHSQYEETVINKAFNNTISLKKMSKKAANHFNKLNKLINS